MGIAPGMLFGSSAGTGFSGFCRFGIRSVDAPPGNRLMFGNFMMDLSNSVSTMLNRAAVHPLSSPAYLPGEVESARIGAAPLKIMSYFSYGSIERLYTAGMDPRS